MTSRLDASYAVIRKTGVPTGWQEKQVADLVRVVGGGTPDWNESAYWRDGGIPWITPTDLTANRNKYICEGAESISDAGMENSNARLVPVGSIIFFNPRDGRQSGDCRRPIDHEPVVRGLGSAGGRAFKRVSLLSTQLWDVRVPSVGGRNNVWSDYSPRNRTRPVCDAGD
jgi:hypothetical protein